MTSLTLKTSGRGVEITFNTSTHQTNPKLLSLRVYSWGSSTHFLKEKLIPFLSAQGYTNTSFVAINWVITKSVLILNCIFSTCPVAFTCYLLTNSFAILIPVSLIFFELSDTSLEGTVRFVCGLNILAWPNLGLSRYGSIKISVKARSKSQLLLKNKRLKISFLFLKIARYFLSFKVLR